MRNISQNAKVDESLNGTPEKYVSKDEHYWDSDLRDTEEKDVPWHLLKQYIKYTFEATSDIVKALDINENLDLIKHDAQLNVIDEKSGTPLLFVVFNETLAIAKQPLESKADPNLQGGEEATPLDAAIYAKNLDNVCYIVRSGAPPNANMEHTSENALGVTCSCGKKAIVHYLPKKHRDTDKKS
ncbi:hypothetical protein BDV41DRAFT_574175 [Aspergillus transmontanensis]|uniref:Ankyrin repeat-containing domain protein n=1 Tax=Aspergillus transmontanensis TaxID=1034304 RepID=A0A5N6W5Q9_9EURO|nr:hypothetical protein BDV41DRAFT_574175 [Aspergillus transmontanensis]